MFPLALFHGLLLSGVAALRLESSADHSPLVKKVGGPMNRFCEHTPGSQERKHRTKPGDSFNDTVIGGTVVKTPDEFPFLAWLGDNDGTGTAQFCGGALISDRVVLTAAHCLYTVDTRNANIYVRFRLTDFFSEKGLVRGIINWKTHEHYDSMSMYNDVALLLLNESVPASIVDPVEVSSSPYNPVENAGNKEVVGWGSLDDSCIHYDTNLRKANVPLGTAGPRCRSPGSMELTINEDFDSHRQLCAGEYGGQEHALGCGDSGGPILAGGPGNWLQVGLASWTYGAQAGGIYPTVFTRVSYYFDWIEAASKELEAQGRKPGVPAGRS